MHHQHPEHKKHYQKNAEAMFHIMHPEACKKHGSRYLTKKAMKLYKIFAERHQKDMEVVQQQAMEYFREAMAEFTAKKANRKYLKALIALTKCVVAKAEKEVEKAEKQLDETPEKGDESDLDEPTLLRAIEPTAEEQAESSEEEEEDNE